MTMEKNELHVSSHEYRCGGFTLMELLVSIAIIAIVLPVLMNSIVALYRANGDTIARTTALTQGTYGVRAVVRDVRSAVYSENGALPIVTAGTSTLTLYTDTDTDGRVERVRYFLNGTVLQKGVIEPTSTSSYPTGNEIIEDLSTGIVNIARVQPVFRYYTSTSTQLTGAFNTLMVRRVDVELVSQSSLANQEADVTLHSSASIRNLKDSY